MVTTIDADPTGCAGIVTVIEVALVTECEAEVPPTVTDVTSVKFVPVRVTVVPPFVEPVDGETELTVGGPTYVYELASVEVPSAVVTATLTAPADPAGAIAVI